MTEPRPRIRHELKTWPDEFQAVLDGLMLWQLRKNDRGFTVGDELLLKEWNPRVYQKNLPQEHRSCEDIRTAIHKAYTGREVLVRVDYIMDADTVRRLIHPLLEPDEMDEFVIMSTSLIP